MNLPFFKKKNTPAKREYLYALEINHQQVKSAVWTIVNNKPHVVSAGPTIEWDDQTQESLVNACDQTISACTEKFDPTGKTQIGKVILGLPSDWLASEKIAQDKLKMLKSVFQKLELNAVGFVVVPEAVVRLLQLTEKMPPTTILIGACPSHLEVTLVKLGKIIGTEIVHRSNHSAADVVEGLSRFPNTDMLPSRMLIYDSGTPLEHLRQQLLAHPWQAPQTRLPFLHFPKIETLPSDFSINAVALAGGSEVAQAIGLIDVQPEPYVPASTPTSTTHHAMPPMESAVEPEEIDPDILTESTEEEQVADSTEPLRPQPLIPEVTSPQDLGFVLDDEPEVISHPESGYALPASGRTARADIEMDSTRTDYESPSAGRRRLPQITLPFSKLPSPKLGVIGVVIVVVLLLIGAGLAYWYIPKATVTLTLDTKALDNQFELTADTSLKSVNESTPAIPATQIETTIEKSESTPATGSKLIGDKSTGSVTIINGTSVPKKFASGTLLTSPSGLKFITTESVEIASASGTADPNSYQPGKAVVKVSAEQIGSDSNLTAGTQFKVGTYSSLDFIAKNDNAFSGGSSRQVQAVSKEDYAKLRSAVTDSAKTQAKTDLMGKINADQIIIEPSIQLSSATEQFDHKVDEVADNVTLKVTVKASGYVVAKNDLNQIVKNVLQPKIPSGYMTTSEPKTDFSVKTADKTKALLDIKASVDVRPEVDTETIRSNLKGKSRSVAREYLQSLPGVVESNIEYSPRLPDPLLTMPHIENNIIVVVP